MNHPVMKAVIFVLITLLPLPAEVVAQETGGGTGCGDIFGDLIHIKRDAATGQPILAKRWIEYPMSIYDWGYCPIAVDASGAELGFAPLSCDIDPLDLERAVELDYFGRLSGGRTKERNSRMHFDEAISNIKLAEAVREEAAGRLLLGYDCAPADGGDAVCASWSTVDSPMASLALYARLMKYGHIQTDPLEVDIWTHGDPAAGTQYHEALGAEDWAKFSGELRHLLARGGGDPAECFGEGFANGFNAACAEPEILTSGDLIRAGSFLAGAADKHGRITPDLVQYTNRILKITLATETTAATLDTLPALILDCGAVAPPPPEGEELPVEPEYPGPCVISDATSGMPAPANERFVDFSAMSYKRSAWRDKLLTVIQQVGVGLWKAFDNVSLLEYLEYANGPEPSDPVSEIPGFVSAASDALRAVEFIHNYEIPVDLGWNDPPTLDDVGDLTILEDAGQQTVPLSGITAGPGDEQALTVTAVSDNPALIPDPTVSYTSPDATGSLSFAPAADGNGAATITVTVDDGMSKSNTVVRAFVVTVTAVNDAPSFVGGGDQETDEDAGAQTVAGWAVASAGPADESGQMLSFIVTNDNNGLFAVQPAVAADGTLTYTPVPDASGSATVSATLSDDGGTDNGGADTSEPQAFSITVAVVNDAPTLDPIGDVMVDEDAGAQTVILSGIAAGAAESQTLTVTASSSNIGLVPTPTVQYTSPDATGSLSFAPAANASGSVMITVTVDDGQAANNTVTRTFQVTVEAVNDKPTDITLSAKVMVDSPPVGTPVGLPVGTLSTADADVGDTFVYSLVAGSGSADNGLFRIAGAAIQTAAILDYRVQNSFSIRVQSRDKGGAGLWTEKIFAITLIPAVVNDFDADGRSDIGCYYPPEGDWYQFRSTDGFWTMKFGYFGTKPVTGDFDGDGKSDIGVYHADSGSWYILKSKEGLWEAKFGYAGTIPVVGDFDGDGRDDIGVYYDPGGNWYLMKSTEGYQETQFGYAGTIPVVGDFDGDGRDDIGVYYAPGGNWYLMKSAEGYLGTTFGYPGTIPVVGDFDGDGRDDIGVYDPTGGTWYLFKSAEGFIRTQFGFAGTEPVVGDFDGDGIADVGVYSPAGGTWYGFNSTSGFWQTEFGFDGAIPVGGKIR